MKLNFHRTYFIDKHLYYLLKMRMKLSKSVSISKKRKTNKKDIWQELFPSRVECRVSWSKKKKWDKNHVLLINPNCNHLSSLHMCDLTWKQQHIYAKYCTLLRINLLRKRINLSRSSLSVHYWNKQEFSQKWINTNTD